MTFGQAPFLCKHRFVAEKPYCRRTPSRAHPLCLSQMFMNGVDVVPKGKMVFEYSSAHVLGEVLERLYNSYLTIGRV